MEDCTWYVSVTVVEKTSQDSRAIRGTLPFIQCELNVIKEEDGGEWYELGFLTLKFVARPQQSYDQLTTTHKYRICVCYGSARASTRHRKNIEHRAFFTIFNALLYCLCRVCCPPLAALFESLVAS